MALTPQQRTATSTGGFDPAIYKKLSGLLTTPATGTGTGTVGGGDGGNDSVVAGAGGGSGGSLGVGTGQGVSSDAQKAALSLIALGDKYPAFLPGGIFAKLLGLLGGVTADSQTSKMAEAQKAIEAIDKQNAAALESGSSRTFDPYGGTKGVMSVSDVDGNVRSFDPYAGDSAKDADKSKALGDSALSTAISNQISNDKTGLTLGELAGITAPVGGVSSLTLDNLGDRPQTNPTTSLPTLGYTGTTLGLLGDFLSGSAVSLEPVPVETRDFVGPMPVMPEGDTPKFSQPTPTPEKPDSNIYADDFVGPMPQNNTLGGGLLGDFAARQDEADASVIASNNVAKENAAIAAALANTTGIDLSAPNLAATTFQGSAYGPAAAAAADKAAADIAAAVQTAADIAAAVQPAAVQPATDANVATGGDVGLSADGLGAPGVAGGDLGQFLAKGGMVNMKRQMHNPPGPDDGYAALQNGEYVIRKKAVQKYGPNIFEQINAGRIPAKRLKSLLE